MNHSEILLIQRSVLGIIKRPGVTLMGLFMSLFFLVAYNAGIGGVGFLPQFSNGGYLAFLLPFCIISLGIGSTGGAGQSIFSDMSSGYFHRLRLTPAPAWVFVAAPIAADAVALVITSSVMLGLGLLFGVPLKYGIISFAGIILMSVLWGISISALSAALILKSGNPQGSQGVVMVFFSAMFITTSFMPYDLIETVWLKKALWFNPITYPLEGMRYLVNGKTQAFFVPAGFAVSGALAIASLVFACISAKKAVE